ncbi:hypothetical protein [Endozoicomonas sp. ONNA2]|uniref:hypothetical protein n=1 Tax=Endozoicomonas sp. ONNA2 TaxID=2828741 RepID=UPI00214996B6|nr:hypothetical protein [Endozoicomonas sp. ONNA2]
MSDPLSTSASSLHSNNNLQPVPEVPLDSDTVGFGRHRVNSNASGETGWLNAAEDMPGVTRVSNHNILEKSQIVSVRPQQLNPAPSLPLPTTSQGLHNSGGNQEQATDADRDTGAGTATLSLAGQDLPDSKAVATVGSDNHDIYCYTDSEIKACSKKSSDEPDEPNHEQCQSLRHTDACWNDPRWVEKNRETREKIEHTVHDHSYEYQPCLTQTITGCDQKYLLETGHYLFNSVKHCNYSHIKITRCADDEVLVNTVRNEVTPLHWFFQCQDQDWVLTGHSYLSPTLVNLSTGKTYQQRGDQHWSCDFMWFGAEASPDGRTLAVAGEFFGINDTEIRFYDFSNPDHGFRWLQSLNSYLCPENEGDAQWPAVWSYNDNNETIATFNMQTDPEKDDESNPLVYSVTLRREGDRMIEQSRHVIREHSRRQKAVRE